MKQLFFTSILLTFLTSSLISQNCEEDNPLFATGVRFHLAIETSPQEVNYVNGKTCSQSFELKNTTEGFSGTTWELYEYPSTPDVFAIKSLGGCDTKWLDGQTCSGTITLRDENYSTNTGLGGTRWIIHNLGEGKYSFESLGSCDTRWLSLQNNDFVLLEDYSEFGGDWRIDIFTKTTVFQSGTEDYHTFRIPSIITTNNGTLIAFCEGRKNGSSDSGNIDLVMKKSSDNGLSWDSLQVVWTHSANTCGNPTPIIDSNNRIWLFMTHNKGADTQHEITYDSLPSDGGRSIWYRYSDNEGASWSSLNDITPFVQLPGTRWDATGPGIGIQKRDGTLMIPAVDRIISSFDGGQTWCRSPNKLGSSETQIVELEDGSIMRNRRHSGIYRKVSESNNNGLTWSTENSDFELPSPKGGCQGSIFRYSFIDDGASRILFSNPADTASLPSNPDKGVRQKMTIRLSLDDGENWTYSKEIWSNFAAYSCVTKLCNNTIGLLYEEGDAIDTNGDYERIVFQNMTLDWLSDWNDPESFPTSISEINNGSIKILIYPNPTHNSINVEIESNPEVGEFEIVNSIGQVVAVLTSSNLNRNHSIDISNLSRGIYFLIMKIDNQIEVKKIVKE